MSYDLEQLVDITKVGNLLLSFSSFTGMACALFDAHENALFTAGWQDICKLFHRQHPISAQRCRNSDAKVKDNLAADCFEHRCENGMMYIALPIHVGSRHIATLVSSQFFYADQPPDKAFFEAQAKECGFDRDAYLAAFEQVPLLAREQVENNLEFLRNVVEMLADTGLTRLKLANKTARLQIAKKSLEKSNLALSLSEAKYRAVADQSLVGISIIEDGHFRYVNAYLAEMFGYSIAELQELSPFDLVAPKDQQVMAQQLQKRLDGTQLRVAYHLHCLKKNSESIDVEVYGTVLTIGTQRMLVGVIQDITDRQRAEREIQTLQEQLREQSIRDCLTGLYNRRYLEETFERELLLAERHQYPVSLIMCDLDHFKEINDRYGHLAGDAVLRNFADILAGSSRSSDIYCRYGGEEFLLIMPRMEVGDAALRAEQLRVSIATSQVEFEGAEIWLTASFGVAAYPAHGTTIDQLIGAADRALYTAKEAGRNRVVTADTIHSAKRD